MLSAVSMLEIDPSAAHYPIDPDRLDLVEEFRRAPKGPHSDELQKVLHRMRWRGEARRYCALVLEPGRKWMLGRLPAVRGQPIERFSDATFTSLADVEWEVFCRRWEAITGRALPIRLRDRAP
jgi:hypothetical protein